MDFRGNFNKLFEPGKIGALELKNRIVMPPMATGFPSILGEATETLAAYFKARAVGGAALLFVEVAAVAATIDLLKQLPRELRLDDDGFAPALAEVAEAVHEGGAMVGIQLTAGFSSQARGAPWVPGQQYGQKILTVGPSGVVHPEVQRPARELKVEEIKEIVDLFGLAAARAKGVGFDVIEIHAHSGFLIGQFLSPYFNRRVDEYGGTPQRRLRFLLEIIEATRRHVGADYPLTVKFSIDEFLEGGRDLKEGQMIARELEKAGINAITVSSGIHGVRLPSIPSMYHDDGAFIPLAEAVKEVVSIPVILPGKLGDPYLAAKVLEEGKAEFVGWGRPLIADPDLPRKVAEGRLDEIRRCVFCNECIRIQWINKSPLRCTVNPTAGRERKYGVVSPAEKKKQVVIVGAGPAGMEAARVASIRGHDVVLYEKSAELGGGQLKLASVPPYKDGLRRIVDYYAACFRKLSNLKVVLGREVTAADVIASGADAVVVATGAEALIPDMPGVGGRNVISAHRLLSGQTIDGETVLVVGGGSAGCEVADLLARQGKKTTVLEMLDSVATDVHSMVRIGLLREMQEHGVKILTGVRVEAINTDGIVAIDKESRRIELVADSVVLAVGAKAKDEISKELAGSIKEIYVIGDARQPRRIRNAISEGYITAFNI